jgi:hypothetical protein
MPEASELPIEDAKKAAPAAKKRADAIPNILDFFNGASKQI